MASVENLTHTSTIINVDPKFISTLEFKNAENIKLISQPLLWLHGIEDDYVAINNGELIFANYTGIKGVPIRVEQANHGDIPSTMGYENYIQTLVDFIQNN